MAKALLLSAALFLLPALALGEVPVRFKSDSPFAVQASATGIASRNSDGISLFLDSIELQAQDKVPISIRVTGMRIGVAFVNSPIGRWDVSHWSSLAVLNEDLSPGRLIEIKKVAVEIPVGDLSMKDRWLLIEVQIIAPNGAKATTYAHTSRRIFEGQDF
jgi:hypothetical protein